MTSTMANLDWLIKYLFPTTFSLPSFSFRHLSAKGGRVTQCLTGRCKYRHPGKDFLCKTESQNLKGDISGPFSLLPVRKMEPMPGCWAWTWNQMLGNAIEGEGTLFYDVMADLGLNRPWSAQLQTTCYLKKNKLLCVYPVIICFACNCYS